MLEEGGRRFRDPAAVFAEVDNDSADCHNLNSRKVMAFRAQLLSSIQLSGFRKVQEEARDEMS